LKWKGNLSRTRLAPLRERLWVKEKNCQAVARIPPGKGFDEFFSEKVCANRGKNLCFFRNCTKM